MYLSWNQLCCNIKSMLGLKIVSNQGHMCKWNWSLALNQCWKSQRSVESQLKASSSAHCRRPSQTHSGGKQTVSCGIWVKWKVGLVSLLCCWNYDDLWELIFHEMSWLNPQMFLWAEDQKLELFFKLDVLVCLKSWEEKEGWIIQSMFTLVPQYNTVIAF